MRACCTTIASGMPPCRGYQYHYIDHSDGRYLSAPPTPFMSPDSSLTSSRTQWPDTRILTQVSNYDQRYAGPHDLCINARQPRCYFLSNHIPRSSSTMGDILPTTAQLLGLVLQTFFYAERYRLHCCCRCADPGDMVQACTLSCLARLHTTSQGLAHKCTVVVAGLQTRLS